MNPINSFVRLRWAWWDGTPPQPGDGLETATGRRYLILKVSGHTLHCQVIGRDETVPGTMFAWEWSVRDRRATR